MRSLLILTAIAALFLALRRSYVFGHDLSVLLFRAHQLPPLIATISVLLCAFSLDCKGTQVLVLIGSCAALLVAAALTIEIAEGLRRMNYWNWSSDMPTFIQIVGCHAFIGAAIGFVVAIAFRMLGKKTKLALHPTAATPKRLEDPAGDR